jgi:protein-S-isoprenylcysteine O-methyltransferase Ste14
LPSWTQIARRIRVPLGFVFAVFYLWVARPSWSRLAIGAGVVALGVGLRACASGHLRKAAEITTTGPYAYTRNPLYLGSVIIAAGFAVAARSYWIALAMAAIFAIIYVPVIRFEEQYLRAQFPAFDDYARHVPRFFPRVAPPQQQVRGSFSSNLYFQHREYNAVLGAAGMLAALVVKMLWFLR